MDLPRRCNGNRQLTSLYLLTQISRSVRTRARRGHLPSWQASARTPSPSKNFRKAKLMFWDWQSGRGAVAIFAALGLDTGGISHVP